MFPFPQENQGSAVDPQVLLHRQHGRDDVELDGPGCSTKKTAITVTVPNGQTRKFGLAFAG